MFKRPRLAQSLLLCFSLSFLGCGGGGSDDTEDDDKKSNKEEEDDDTGKDDSKSKDDDKSTKDDSSSTEDDKSTKDADPLVKAREVFDENCKACHGAAGAGKDAPKTSDMSSAEAKEWKDAYITDSITDGIKAKGMPSFKDKLSSDEIESLLKLIRCFQEKSDADACGKP